LCVRRGVFEGEGECCKRGEGWRGGGSVVKVCMLGGICCKGLCVKGEGKVGSVRGRERWGYVIKVGGGRDGDLSVC
jgi:hypothetical protein